MKRLLFVIMQGIVEDANILEIYQDKANAESRLLTLLEQPLETYEDFWIEEHELQD